jgi:hypothetical protein
MVTRTHPPRNSLLSQRRGPVAIAAGLLVALMTVGVAEAEDAHEPAGAAGLRALDVSLSTSADYSQGRYGTAHTTQILSVPTALTWHATDRLDLTLTIPYLWEHGHQILAGVGAARAPTQPTQQARTESGLGDILLEGEYALLEESDWVPEFSPFLEIKFPTADSRRGLGTGEFDETLGVNVEQSLGDRWTTHVTVSYTFVGSPPHNALDNSFAWSVGVSYQVTPSLSLATYLDGATAVSRQEQNPLELRVEARYKLPKMIELTTKVTAGLSQGSADFGVSAGIKVRF